MLCEPRARRCFKRRSIAISGCSAGWGGVSLRTIDAGFVTEGARFRGGSGFSATTRSAVVRSTFARLRRSGATERVTSRHKTCSSSLILRAISRPCLWLDGSGRRGALGRFLRRRLSLLAGLLSGLLSLLGDHWFWQRQRHLFAGFDHVELTRQQHHEAPLVTDAASDAAGLVSGAPIKIRARGPENGGAGILRHHQAAKFCGWSCALDRQVRLDGKRRSPKRPPFHRNGTARGGPPP